MTIEVKQTKHHDKTDYSATKLSGIPLHSPEKKNRTDQ